MKKRWLILILAGVLLLAASCGDGGGEPVEINPQSDAASKQTMNVNLYFGSSSYGDLVCETRSIEIPVNESVESVIINELIKGSTVSSTEFRAVINPNTTVVSTSETGDVLFVTLSQEFLDWSWLPSSATAQTSLDTVKYTSVYSIVNTIIELGSYSRVQLLVDTDGSGMGQRIRRSEVGFSGDGILEPLDRNGDIVLTPSNTMRRIFDSVISREYETAYGYVAYNDDDGTEKDDLDTFSAALRDFQPSLESYEVRDSVLGADGASAVVMVDYTIREVGQEPEERTNIPVTLKRENGVWKISYTNFEKVFLTV